MSRGSSFLGWNRGIYVLAWDTATENNAGMSTVALSSSSQEITKPRSIGFVVYPGCEILDVCGPYDAFYYADIWLTRLGKTKELWIPMHGYRRCARSRPDAMRNRNHLNSQLV